MSFFSIEYIVKAPDLNTATAMAHDNVYLAEIEVEQVRVKEVESSSRIRTFNEPAEKAPTD